MRLHIVEKYHSVAMQQMAQGVANDLGASIGDDVDPEALNYHMPWHFVLNTEGGRHAISYTHKNPGVDKSLEEACARSEAVFCMSFRGRQEILDLGVSPKKVWVAYPGHTDFPGRRKNIGIVGFHQPNGRKRDHILVDLAWMLPPETKNFFNFLLLGDGWDHIAEEATKAGLTITHVGPKPSLPNDSYNVMDALLVTAYAEGGPIPMLEAYGAGVPVYSPRVGFAADWGEPEYLYKTPEELASKLSEWIAPMRQRMELGHLFNWTRYAEEHAMVFSKLLGEEWGEDKGWPRYRQLLDVVEEVKPRTICEIGTWTGQRAVQMLQTAAKYQNIQDLTYYGFDLFGDATLGKLRDEFSKTPPSMNSVSRRLRATGADIDLVKGDTVKTLKGRVRFADLFFIDGGHSTATIANDWAWVEDQMRPGVVAVLDDYVTDGPEGYGCQELVNGLDREKFEVEILPKVTKTDNGNVQMAKVTKRA